MDTIRVYNNGSVQYLSNRGEYNLKVSNESLQQLTQIIKSKKYSSKTQSILTKWLEPTCCDMLYTSYLINQNGKTIKITPDKTMSDMILNIEEKTHLD